MRRVKSAKRGSERAVPSWFYPDPLQLKSALFVSLVEPGKGLILLAQACVDEGYADRGYIFLCGTLLELVEHRSRLAFLT